MIESPLTSLAPSPLPASAPSASTLALEGPVSEPPSVPIFETVSTLPVPVPSLTPPMPPTPASSESVSTLTVSAPAQVVPLSALLALALASALILPVSALSEPVTALAAFILSLPTLMTSVTPPLSLMLASSESVPASIIASVSTPEVSFFIPPAAAVILPMPSPTPQVSVPFSSDPISALPVPVSFLPEPISILLASASVLLDLILPATISTMVVSVLALPKPVSVPLTNSPSALVHSSLATHSLLLPVSASTPLLAPPAPFSWCKNTIKTVLVQDHPSYSHTPHQLQPSRDSMEYCCKQGFAPTWYPSHAYYGPPVPSTHYTKPPPFNVIPWQSTTFMVEHYMAPIPSIGSGSSYYMPSNYDFPYSGLWQANPVFSEAISDARPEPGESLNMSGNVDMDWYFTLHLFAKMDVDAYVAETTNAEAGPLGTTNETERPIKKKQKAAKSNVEEILKPKSKPLQTEEQDNKIKEVPQKFKSRRKSKAKAVEAIDDIVEISPPSKPPKAHCQSRCKAEDDKERSQTNNNVEAANLPLARMRPPPSKSCKAEVTMTMQQKPLFYVSVSVQDSYDKETKETSDTKKEPAKKK
ncbi:hypothetical protein C0995_004581 [Termitomyces sp. Mi166|nr:hypothetical protein C0995_004581 [Termitomyces sp. Mi166\